MQIRPAKPLDSASIVLIYNHYIDNSHATFEVERIDVNEMHRRINEIQAGGYPFLICQDEDEIVGYAYANRYKARLAYQHSVEVTVYIKDGFAAKASERCFMSSYFPS